MHLSNGLVAAKNLVSQNGDSVADDLFDSIMGKIARGDWPVGYAIPTEKEFLEEFGISRIAVRECILKLRAVGILNGSRGRRTTVARLDSRKLGHLFPLILANEGQQSFEHIFQLRLIIESNGAYLAAQRRTASDAARMKETLRVMKAVDDGDMEAWIETDRLLHMQIQQATQNPLYSLLCEALWGFLHLLHPIIHKGCPERREADEIYHTSLVEAIEFQNADRARVEMEAHLQSSADNIRHAGVLQELGAGA
jgi:GntR family transcriptional repressor for pyruvate dehydrogenase complex